MQSIRSRLTYANVIATIAVFLALGGGGFAVASHLTVRASDIKKNAVRSKHIKKGHVRTGDLAGGAVKRGKLAPDAVDSARVADGSLIGNDIADSSIGRVDLASGSVNASKVINNSLTGSDINEASLSVPRMGCQSGLVKGAARIKASSSMPGSPTGNSRWVDRKHNCASGPVTVARASAGRYFIRFVSSGARLAVATSNFEVTSAARDNIVAVAFHPHPTTPEFDRFEVDVRDNDGGRTDSWFDILVY